MDIIANEGRQIINKQDEHRNAISHHLWVGKFVK